MTLCWWQRILILKKKRTKKKRNRKLKENRKQNSKKRATFIDKDKEDSAKNAKNLNYLENSSNPPLNYLNNAQNQQSSALNRTASPFYSSNLANPFITIQNDPLHQEIDRLNIDTKQTLQSCNNFQQHESPFGTQHFQNNQKMQFIYQLEGLREQVKLCWKTANYSYNNLMLKINAIENEVINSEK